MLIRDIIRKIAKYLEGDYFLHFKLTCEEIKEFLHDIKPEPVRVNKSNFERTLLIPGIHIIELNCYINDWIYSIKDTSRVTDLILDFSECRENLNFVNLFNIFKDIKSLRIINMKLIPWPNKIHFAINGNSKINRLEIYTNLPITLKFEKDMKIVKLYTLAHTQWVISLTVPSYKSVEHFQYYTESGIEVDINDVYIPPKLYKYGRKDFVPNPKYIQ